WLADYINIEDLTTTEKLTVLKTVPSNELWRKVASSTWTASLENWTYTQVFENLFVAHPEDLKIIEEKAEGKLRLAYRLITNTSEFEQKDKEALANVIGKGGRKLPKKLLKLYFNQVPEAQKWASAHLDIPGVGQILAGTAGITAESTESLLTWAETSSSEDTHYAMGALYYNPWADHSKLTERAESCGFVDLAAGQRERWLERNLPEGEICPEALLRWMKPNQYRFEGRLEAVSAARKLITADTPGAAEFVNELAGQFIPGIFEPQIKLWADDLGVDYEVSTGSSHVMDTYDPFEKTQPNESFPIGGGSVGTVAKTLDSLKLTADEWKDIYLVIDSLPWQTSVGNLVLIARGISQGT
ncbi:MAG: hypothetical protein KDD60_12795, partial [Bdellovibrionales bacterium]|nr:hypothetical protein [Bdellovibrionales bacterium]